MAEKNYTCANCYGSRFRVDTGHIRDGKLMVAVYCEAPGCGNWSIEDSVADAFAEIHVSTAIGEAK